jgi:mevalonate kinase
MTSNHYLETPSKWILCGEHAVLRGHSAIVFPNNLYLKLTYQNHDEPLTISCKGPLSDLLPSLIPKLAHKALELSHQPQHQLKGSLEVVNEIPAGIGLGFSASLCVSVARWLQACGLIKVDDLLDLCTQLEHTFHGTSSGLDVACVLRQQPLLYQQGTCKPFTPQWQPCFSLTNSQSPAHTHACIDTVKRLQQNNPSQAKELDQAMHQASQQAFSALMQPQKTGLALLQQAIYEANQCFEQWSLCTPAIKTLQQDLQEKGALASKPSGAGLGGLVLALWPEPPLQLPDHTWLVG